MAVIVCVFEFEKDLGELNRVWEQLVCHSQSSGIKFRDMFLTQLVRPRPTPPTYSKLFWQLSYTMFIL